MRNYIIIILSFLSLQCIGQEYLEPYYKLAVAKNPSLQAALLNYKAAEKKAEQAGFLPDPMGNIGVFILPVETRVGAQRATFSLTQQFPWFGTLSKEKQIALNEVQTAFYQYKEAENQLVRDIGIAYHQLFFINSAIKVSTEDLDLLKVRQRQLKTAYETGKTSLNRLLMLQVEEEKYKNSIVRFKEEKRAALSAFLKLIDYAIDTSAINFPDSLPSLELPVITNDEDTLFYDNPQIKGLHEQSNKWKNREDLAKLQGKPSFNLGFNYILISKRDDMVVPDNGKDALMLPMAGIRLPIYRKKYKAAVEEAQLRNEATVKMIDAKENELQNSLIQFSQAYEDARHRYQLNQRLTELTQNMIRLGESAFTTGEGNFSDLIEFQEELLMYRLNALKAKIEMNNNVIKIKHIIGNI